MRGTIACLLLLVGFTSAAGAAVTLYSHGFTYTGPTSSVSLQVNLLDAQLIPIANVPVSGSLPVDFSFDASNSGTIWADNSLGGGFSLANVTRAFAGFLIEGTAQTVNVSGKLALGPEAVVNRHLTIDAGTAGGLTLESGLLKLTLSGGGLYELIVSELGTNVVVFDLSANPLSFQFANLGTTTLAAFGNAPYEAGLPYGAELRLPLAMTTTMDTFGAVSGVSISGMLYVGDSTVPEVTSFGLLSLSIAGLGGLVALRRHAA